MKLNNLGSILLLEEYSADKSLSGSVSLPAVSVIYPGAIHITAPVSLQMFEVQFRLLVLHETTQ